MRLTLESFRDIILHRFRKYFSDKLIHNLNKPRQNLETKCVLYFIPRRDEMKVPAFAAGILPWHDFTYVSERFQRQNHSQSQLTNTEFRNAIWEQFPLLFYLHVILLFYFIFYYFIYTFYIVYFIFYLFYFLFYLHVILFFYFIFYFFYFNFYLSYLTCYFIVLFYFFTCFIHPCYFILFLHMLFYFLVSFCIYFI